MTTQNTYRATFAANLAAALEASDSQTEVVRVELVDMTPEEAVEALDAAWEFGEIGGGWEYYDYTDANEGVDVWFTGPDKEARVLFTK